MTRRVPLLEQIDARSVVVFRALQLGDMLCAVPALRALRAALPATRIALVGLPWARQFAQRFGGYVDDFFAFPGHAALPEQSVAHERVAEFYAAMQAQRFDLAIQMHGSGDVSNGIVASFGARRTAGFGAPVVAGFETGGCPFPTAGAEPLRLLRLTDWLGAPAIGAHLEFPLSADDERELQASGIGAELTPGSYLCIHPGARTRDKCWPPALFASVADRLAGEFGLRVVLTGSAAEADLTAAVAHAMRHPAVDAAAPISIGAMAALMSRARLLVCNDTGVSHIAAGLKLPSVVVFSKADIQRWAPLDRELHRCLWDPEGQQVPAVLQHARSLLAGTAPRREEASGPRAAVPAPSW